MVQAAGDGGGGGGQVLTLKPDQLKVVVAALQETATELEQCRADLLAVKASSFGGSWMGSYVQGHSEKAYQAVSEALADNMTALQHYESALTELDKNAQDADDNTTQAITTGTANLDQVSQQFDLGADCTVAGAGDPTVACTP